MEGIPLTPEMAPQFCLPALNYSTSTLCLHECRGKVVLLLFWVTWCPACVADLPKKEVFYQSLQHPDLLFFTVNVSGREADPTRVGPFLEEHGYTFPVLIDEGRKTYDDYGLKAVPTTVLIDRKGTIAGRYDETTHFVNVLEKAGQLLK